MEQCITVHLLRSYSKLAESSRQRISIYKNALATMRIHAVITGADLRFSTSKQMLGGLISLQPARPTDWRYFVIPQDRLPISASGR
jgi:hypothetical protein